MEELIEKMKSEGKVVNGKKLVEDESTSPDTSRSRHTSEARSPSSNDPDPAEDGMNRYIGTYFWRSLSSEVGATISYMAEDPPKMYHATSLTNWRSTGPRPQGDNGR